MHHVISRLGKIAVFALLVFSAPEAFAVIKIAGVTGVSNSKNLTTTTSTDGTSTTPTIFGGVAGAVDQGSTELAGSCLPANRIGGQTCNNCIDNGNTDDTRFSSCSTARIYPDLQATFTLSSDTVETGGVIYIVDDDNEDDRLDDSDTTDGLAKNQTGTISVPWSVLCEAVGAGALCDTSASGEVKIGVSAAKDDSLEESGDDTITVKIIVQGDLASVHTDCSSGGEGVCQFDMAPGDGKAKIGMLESVGSFPSTGVSGLNYENVLLFFVDETQGQFTAINPTSDFYSLPITDSEDDDEATFSLDSEIVDGLENEVKYYFKVALQDEAMNIGYWTPDSLSIDCATTTPLTNTPPCHTAKPGEVLGILSKDVSCFIATAAWGSPMAPQVDTFRAFRNTYLLPYKWGRAFVKTYYKYGAIAAGYIKKSETLRAGARVALTPLLGFAWLAMKIGVFGAFAVSILLIAAPIAAIQIRNRRKPTMRNNA